MCSLIFDAVKRTVQRHASECKPPHGWTLKDVTVSGEGGAEAAGHRVLVFAQLKGLLDIVERDVLAAARALHRFFDYNAGAPEHLRPWII